MDIHWVKPMQELQDIKNRQEDTTIPHIIILDSIADLQGESTTGTGSLELLRGLMNNDVAPLEELSPPLTQPQQDVMDKAHDIEEMFENGFTAEALGTATGELKDLCELL